MNTDDFDYILPKELIAQQTAPRPRKLPDAGAGCRHRHGPAPAFQADAAELLRQGDLLVFNDTKVVPARLFCHGQSGGKVELLFTRQIDRSAWSALAKPGRRVRAGAILYISEAPGRIALNVEAVAPDGERVIRLLAGCGADRPLAELIERYGVMPLPPYIGRPADYADRALPL